MSDWISVKDRLPDTFDDVLVYSNDCCVERNREKKERNCWLALELLL